MAQTVAVVRANLPTSGTVDFVKTGFGTPSAAIFIMCDATTTSNPRAEVQFSVGLWDGTNQRMIGVVGWDNRSAGSTNQRASDDSYVLAGITPSGGLAFTYAASAITDGVRLTQGGTVSSEHYATCILIGGVSAKVVTFSLNGTQNATTTSASLGFAPKLVFFAYAGVSAADTSWSGNNRFSFGFAEIGGTHRALCWGANDGQADEAASMMFSETRCLGFSSPASGFAWGGEVTTFGADTFTITSRDGAPTLPVAFALALGGADLSYDVGTLTTPTSTGDSVVATDIAPDALIAALGTATGTTHHTDSGANGYMIGFADDDGEFSHTVQVEDGASTTNSNSVASATAVLNLDSSSGGSRTDMCDATVTLNSADFTLNYTTVDGTARKGWWVAFGAAGGGTNWWGGSNANSWNRLVVNRD